ncbi:pleckstrin homology domain-containing family A member 8-like [Diadema antillarum]|uniref:pleckstrin homology domain-containing family A member 8-like n=1 Tax=Diadema antillarum TaxID=105358 RepID=UPI003A86412D
MSFYQRLETCFRDVPADGIIETDNFLEASRVSIIPLLDILGSTAFGFVKKDVNGNIEKLKRKYDEDPEEFRTLQAIVDHEVNQGTTLATNSATDALMWLTRGLNFICLFIKNVIDRKNDGEDIKPCIFSAYDNSLKEHHNWIVRKAAGLAFMAAPYYSDLMAALRGESDEETLRREVEEYHRLLQQHVNTIQDIYISRSIQPRPLTT